MQEADKIRTGWMLLGFSAFVAIISSTPELCGFFQHRNELCSQPLALWLLIEGLSAIGICLSVFGTIPFLVNTKDTRSNCRWRSYIASQVAAVIFLSFNIIWLVLGTYWIVSASNKGTCSQSLSSFSYSMAGLHWSIYIVSVMVLLPAWMTYIKNRKFPIEDLEGEESRSTDSDSSGISVD